MEEHPAATVFISYNWGIQETALELKKKLEENNITCWMDSAKLAGGDDLKAEVEKGIKECKVGFIIQNICEPAATFTLPSDASYAWEISCS